MNLFSIPKETLDPFDSKNRIRLDGLVTPADPGEQQHLTGEYVRMVDITAPNASPPTRAQTDDFFFSVPTNNFSAVNAYYHCDRLFRMMEEMGFDVQAYFDRRKILGLARAA